MRNKKNNGCLSLSIVVFHYLIILIRFIGDIQLRQVSSRKQNIISKLVKYLIMLINI